MLLNENKPVVVKMCSKEHVLPSMYLFVHLSSIHYQQEKYNLRIVRSVRSPSSADTHTTSVISCYKNR